MYDYNICTEADVKLFEGQCRALERHIPGIRREQRLKDVDGTIVQEYRIGRDKVTVHNDETVGALYVRSDIPLEPYFEEEPPRAQAVI